MINCSYLQQHKNNEIKDKKLAITMGISKVLMNLNQVPLFLHIELMIQSVMALLSLMKNIKLLVSMKNLKYPKVIMQLLDFIFMTKKYVIL